MVKEIYCDGLGACLGNCPTNALTLIEEDVEPYDEEATLGRIKDMLEKHVKHQRDQAGKHQQVHTESKDTHACPGATVMQWDEKREQAVKDRRVASELRQWPVQISLVPPTAPYLRNADIAVIADCVPFAYANLHEDFLKDRTVLVGCPKFDDAEAYIEKIAQIIKQAQPKSIRVVRMVVPCCSGLTHIVAEARKRADSSVPLEQVIVGIKGGIE